MSHSCSKFVVRCTTHKRCVASLGRGLKAAPHTLGILSERQLRSWSSSAGRVVVRGRPMALWPYGPMALWPYGPMACSDSGPTDACCTAVVYNNLDRLQTPGSCRPFSCLGRFFFSMLLFGSVCVVVRPRACPDLAGGHFAGPPSTYSTAFSILGSYVCVSPPRNEWKGNFNLLCTHMGAC